MTSLIVNGSHLILALAGLAAIGYAARQARWARYFWPLTFALTALMAARLLQTSMPKIHFEDFKDAYWTAGKAVWQGTASFAHVYDRGTDGFVNIPIVAFLFAPFGLLSEIHAGYAFFALSALDFLAIWLLLIRVFPFDRFEAGACLFALAAFGPLIYSIREGNISHFILAMILLAVLWMRTGADDVKAGVLFGLAALLKPPLLLIGVYFFLRGRWKIVLGGAAAIAVCAGASIALFGWATHVTWYAKSILPFADGPMTAFNVQSVPATFVRIEAGMDSFWEWKPSTPSPMGQAAIWAITALTLAGAGWACLGRGPFARIGEAETEAELYLVLTLACVLSTLTWSHYYVWTIPAIALCYVKTKPGAGLAPAWRWILAGAVLLIAPAVFLSTQMRWRGFGEAAVLLVSHMLFGALLLLLVQIKTRRAMGAPYGLELSEAGSYSATK